jgi:hypothetical protein
LAAALETLNRVRPAHSFLMRDLLFSEIATDYGIANIPDDPRLAIAASKAPCENLLTWPAMAWCFHHNLPYDRREFFPGSPRLILGGARGRNAGSKVLSARAAGGPNRDGQPCRRNN